MSKLDNPQHGGHASSYRENHPRVCSGSVPSFLCGIFKEKKTNDSGGWSNVLHWSKKKKKTNRKQELTGRKVAKESRGPALGKEAKSESGAREGRWNNTEQCREANLTRAIYRKEMKYPPNWLRWLQTLRSLKSARRDAVQPSKKSHMIGDHKRNQTCLCGLEELQNSKERGRCGWFLDLS